MCDFINMIIKESDLENVGIFRTYIHIAFGLLWYLQKIASNNSRYTNISAKYVKPISVPA